MKREFLARLGAVGVLAGLAGAGYLFLQHAHRPTASAMATAEDGVPVIAAVAATQDVPLIVRGIGTVQAYNMAVIKTRVDGAIVKVSFSEGQEVKAGDPLFQIDPRPFQAALDQAQAAKERNEAQLVSAELDLYRDRTLSKEGYQSRQSFDEQTAVVRALKGLIASDQAAITNARLNLDYADIRAPFDGRTGTRLVDIGNLVQAAQATSLVTITQVKPIFVNFTVPQNVNDQVREKQAEGPLTVIALGDDPKVELARGEVTVIDNQIDVTTGTLRLKASFPNADQRLWPGQFVNVRLVLAERKGVTTVSQRAVMQGPGGYFAYVVKPDGTAERRTLELGGTQDGIAVILRGISPGETVALEGQYRLTDGARAQIDAASSGSAATASPPRAVVKNDVSP
jgi:multidrug efflux system membrane fusion protein